MRGLVPVAKSEICCYMVIDGNNTIGPAMISSSTGRDTGGMWGSLQGAREYLAEHVCERTLIRETATL